LRKLLITGGCGVIGTILKSSLAQKYDITCLDTRLTGKECVVGDITNLDSIRNYFAGKDAVVHLAGDSNLEAEWSSIYRANILGTYNVFEAAAESGIKKIVFASSNHVTGLYENDWPISCIVKGDYEGLDRSKIPIVSHLSPPRADSYYGASKLFGEGLGQYYSYKYGMSVICLRIGTVRPYEWPLPSEIRFFATWLSHSDLIQLVEKSLDLSGVSFDVFYGVSNNTWRFWDIEHPRVVIGYDSHDNANDHRAG
jgi:nucleoside-diphosphate-sugar epimerase